ncbi:hypothetical protein HYC85_018204 [Camellia sinensis]|uniref:Seipin n=1 Tax=Camellia sinensis TaxID=4442 RepID=A0A7J7GUK2_CAMSI|nr:hypothetical protein HYC85_018204 [Camellia sinensis]
MDVEEKKDYYYYYNYFFPPILPNPLEIIYNCFLTLFSPFFSLFSLISESFRQAEEAKDTVESAVHAAARAPCTVAHGTSVLVRKIGMGLLGAVRVCMVLIMVMALAIVLGVGLVELWVEEPVVVRERLNFDYTQVHPNAILSFDGGQGRRRKKMTGVPVGHTFYVSLVLLLPESDYNRQVGVFQLNAELISTKGNAIAKSSQPCMLRFRSLPVRLARTFLMSIPLLLGITDETQKINIPLYEAEIIINSQLPWRKEIVRRWKWTFYVWTSLYMYIIFVIVLVCCFKPLIFPMMIASSSEPSKEDSALEESKEPKERGGEERDVLESFRKRQRNRRKRKAMLLHRVLPDTTCSSASSISITRDEMIVATEEEDAGDSESVCFGG